VEDIVGGFERGTRSGRFKNHKVGRVVDIGEKKVEGEVGWFGEVDDELKGSGGETRDHRQCDGLRGMASHRYLLSRLGIN
jgi:hypothetical protein